MPRLDCNI